MYPVERQGEEVKDQELSELRKSNADLAKKNKQLIKIVSALQDINVAYRFGGRPKEKSLDILEKARQKGIY